MAPVHSCAVRDQRGRGAAATEATCVAWQAARAARARSIAAWSSNLLTLRACGFASDTVSFTSFRSEPLVSAFGMED